MFMPKGTKQAKEATINDVLAAINTFANNTEQRFRDVEEGLTTVNREQTKQHIALFDVKSALHQADARLNSLPTKDYLDEKIGSLRGDITGEQKVTREAIRKVVKALERKKIFQVEEAKSILKLVSFQPE